MSRLFTAPCGPNDHAKLTFQACDFSSHTAINTFRIGVTGCNAIQSFSDANIMANSIQIVITVKTGSNYQRATGNDLETWTTPCPCGLGCTYGQFGSILWLVPAERASPKKSKSRFLILNYLNFSIRIYDIKQTMVSHR